MAALDELGVSVAIYPRPSEVVAAIPFAEDEVHRSYDPVAARRFWLGLVQAHRVMLRFRSGFIGKASPVHFFWGGADLATTRFSGRRAPEHRGGVPNCPDWVQVLAYSHEVSSCGYWPGGGGEGNFYSYAYPAAEGFAAWPVEPAEAFYDAGNITREDAHPFLMVDMFGGTNFEMYDGPRHFALKSIALEAFASAPLPADVPAIIAIGGWDPLAALDPSMAAPMVFVRDRRAPV